MCAIVPPPCPPTPAVRAQPLAYVESDLLSVTPMRNASSAALNGSWRREIGPFEENGP